MIFRFDSFEIDEEAGELRHNGEAVSIQPKPLALLQLLIRERERVVSLDELFETLWPDTIVTPGSLTRAVSHARRALGDRRSAIRSYPRRGYRFVGRVVEIDRKAGRRPVPSPDGGRAAGYPFVGRAEALDKLQKAWAQAASGCGACALVSGPAGIGKTRLVDVFLAEIGRQGPVVLVGRCRDGEGAPAFWLWAQILRQLLREESLAREVNDLTGGSGVLADLFPELGGEQTHRAARDDLSPQESRFLFFDAVARTLSRCSRSRPLVLVLEDLQWVRAPSLRLLEHVACEVAGDPILIVGVVRDEVCARGQPLDRTISILRRQERCTQISLESFSRAEVAALLEQMIGRPPPVDLTSELFARTEGIPLFLREATRLLAERGDLRHPERISRRGVALPGASFDLIRRALGSLSRSCSEIIEAASVVGREFSLPGVAGIAGVPREEALDLLDEAVGAGVVEPTAHGVATYRFTHALFREAAYEGMTAGRRARLHHRAAERLERKYGDDQDRVIAELAHHHHRGIAVGDPERAFACAIRAAKRASRLLAYEQAAMHYEQANAALDHCQTVDPTRRLETLQALGEASRIAGKRRGEAFGQATSRDSALIALIGAACDRIALGDAAGARRLREEADAVAGDAPQPAQAWPMRVYDTGLALMEGRFDGVEQRINGAFRLGRRSEHPHALEFSIVHRAELASARGEHAEVSKLLAQALSKPETAQPWLHAVVARSQLALGAQEAARSVFEELAANDFEDLPRNARWTKTVMEIAMLCADLADVDRAGLLVDLLAPIERHHGVLPVPICYAGPVSRCLARLFETLGRGEEAARLYDDALEACAALGARPMQARVQLESGALAARSGDERRARERLTASVHLARAIGMPAVETAAAEALTRFAPAAGS